MSSFTPSELQYMQSHVDDNRSVQIHAPNIVCLVAAYLAVSLRLFARSLTKAKYGLDDWLIGVSLVWALLSCSHVRRLVDPSLAELHRLCRFEQSHYSLWHGKTHHSCDQSQGPGHCNVVPCSPSKGNTHQDHSRYWLPSASTTALSL